MNDGTVSGWIGNSNTIQGATERASQSGEHFQPENLTWDGFDNFVRQLAIYLEITPGATPVADCGFERERKIQRGPIRPHWHSICVERSTGGNTGLKWNEGFNVEEKINEKFSQKPASGACCLRERGPCRPGNDVGGSSRGFDQGGGSVTVEDKKLLRCQKYKQFAGLQYWSQHYICITQSWL